MSVRNNQRADDALGSFKIQKGLIVVQGTRQRGQMKYTNPQTQYKVLVIEGTITSQRDHPKFYKPYNVVLRRAHVFVTSFQPRTSAC